LRIIVVMRQAWRSRPDERAQPDAFAAFEAHYWRTLWARAAALAGEIADQPLRTMDDVVDRAIVLAWGNGDVPMDDILEPILVLGGVTFAQCDHLEGA
jgi:hypothetical protein